MLKFCIVNLKVGPLSSHSCDCFDALWAPRHKASKICTSHTPIHGLIHSVLPLQHKRQPNTAETWQQGYETVRFVAWYSFLYCRAVLDEARLKQRCKWIWYTLVANFASRVSPCAEIVEPFKLLLHVTAHPQFFELELRAPMGTCPGQHGTAACS